MDGMLEVLEQNKHNTRNRIEQNRTETKHNIWVPASQNEGDGVVR